jgi:hypothetical protein
LFKSELAVAAMAAAVADALAARPGSGRAGGRADWPRAVSSDVPGSVASVVSESSR